MPSPDELPENLRTRGGCGSCGKKSLGGISYVRAMMSGKVPESVAKERMTACEACNGKDSAGERLFRIVEGKPFCGLPRLKKPYRDESKDGCGCPLKEKVLYRQSSCPIGRWGPWSEKRETGKDG